MVRGDTGEPRPRSCYRAVSIQRARRGLARTMPCMGLPRRLRARTTPGRLMLNMLLCIGAVASVGCGTGDAPHRGAVSAVVTRTQSRMEVRFNSGVRLTLLRVGDLDEESSSHGPRGDASSAQVSYVSATEVTIAEWKSALGLEPVRRSESLIPYECRTTLDAAKMIDRLNELDVDVRFSIPTEAQWESACLDSPGTAWCFGNDPSRLTEFAWFRDNSGWRSGGPPVAPRGKNVEGPVAYEGSVAHVATKRPSARGLFDMHGNLWELCRVAAKGANDVERLGGESPPRGEVWCARGGAYTSSREETKVSSRGTIDERLPLAGVGIRVWAEVRR